MKKPESPPSLAKLKGNTILLFSGETLDKLSLIEKEYPYWSDFKYKVKAIPKRPQALWYRVKTIRNGSAKYFRISNSPLFKFKYNITASTQKLLHEFDLNFGGSLIRGSGIAEEDKDRYLMNSIMEESIASSQIEGAVTTREAAKDMLRKERKPRNKSEQMIFNNYVTIKRILELKDKPLTIEMLLDIHKIMTKDTLEDIANEGRFRTNNEVVVEDAITHETVYSPPDYKYVDEVIPALCAFANSNNDDEFIHPVVRASVLHFLIGYIHPFVDGNGRTARAIFYWYLLSKDYWLVEYMSISRIIKKSPSQYAAAYLHSELDENDVTYFINYQLKALDQAYKELKEFLERKNREKKELLVLVKTIDVNNRQQQLIQSFINDANKTMTVKEVSVIFAISNQTANTDLMGLAKKGFLSYKKIGKTLTFFKSDKFDFKVGRVGKKKK